MRARVAVIGAGIGGLTSAALLAARGAEVTVFEQAAWVGGKARRVKVDGAEIDGGPTVFTYREVFEEVFAACGARLDDHVTAHQAEVIARHAWDDGARLDLYADPARSIDAVGAFAGAAAARGPAGRTPRSRRGQVRGVAPRPAAGAQSGSRARARAWRA